MLWSPQTVSATAIQLEVVVPFSSFSAVRTSHSTQRLQTAIVLLLFFCRKEQEKKKYGGADGMRVGGMGVGGMYV